VFLARSLLDGWSDGFCSGRPVLPRLGCSDPVRLHPWCRKATPEAKSFVSRFNKTIKVFDIACRGTTRTDSDWLQSDFYAVSLTTPRLRSASFCSSETLRYSQRFLSRHPGD